MGNIPEFNLPQETSSLQRASPQSLVSERIDFTLQHSEPTNIVVRSMEVPPGPDDVETIGPHMVSKLFCSQICKPSH